MKWTELKACVLFLKNTFIWGGGGIKLVLLLSIKIFVSGSCDKTVYHFMLLSDYADIIFIMSKYLLHGYFYDDTKALMTI